MNSVLQCLTHTPPLAELCLQPARLSLGAEEQYALDPIAATQAHIKRALSAHNAVRPRWHASNLKAINRRCGVACVASGCARVAGWRAATAARRWRGRAPAAAQAGAVSWEGTGLHGWRRRCRTATGAGGGGGVQLACVGPNGVWALVVCVSSHVRAGSGRQRQAAAGGAGGAAGWWCG
jgi:hypothetical protein